MLTRDDIVDAARGWVGTPYHHQASVRGVGCDCLGFVRGVYAEIMGFEAEDAPPYTRDWAEASGVETLLDAAGRHLTVIDKSQAAAGDVIVFRILPGMMAKHCGILTGPNSMIHAQDGCVVCEVALGASWWRRAAGVFRFPLDEGAA